MADYSDLGIIPATPQAQAPDNKYADLGIIPAQGNPNGARSLAANSPDAGLVDALVKGAAQGSTFGFGDELGGLAGALGDRAASQGLLGATGEAISSIPKALGLIHGADTDKFLQAYRNIIPEVRQDFKSAEENHPIGSFAGNLVGGVLTGSAAKGLGLLGKAAPAATDAGQVAQKASALQNIGKAAAAGTGIGALTGLGGSEADLTSGRNDQTLQALKDTLEGAGVGGVTGGALSGIGESAKAVGNILKKRAEPYGDLRIFKAMKGAYGLGKDEVNLTGNEAFKAAGDNLNNTVKEIGDAVEGVAGKLRQVKQGVLQGADAEGIMGDATEALENALDRAQGLPENTPLERTEKNKLISLVKDRLEGVEKEKTVTANYKTFKPQPAKVSVGTPSTETQLRDEKMLHDVSDLFQGTTPQRNVNIIDAPDGSGRQIGIVHDANSGKLKVRFLNPEIPPTTPQDAVKMVPGQLSQNVMVREGGKPIDTISNMDQLKQSYQKYAFDQNYHNKDAENIVKELAHGTKNASEIPLNMQVPTVDPTSGASLGSQTVNPLSDVNEKLHNVFKAQDSLPTTQTLQQMNTTSNSSVSAGDKVAEFLNHLKGADPNLSGQVGDQLENAANRFDLAKMANPNHGFGGLTGTAKSLAVSGANTAGLLAGDFARATPDSIKAFGSTLAQAGGATAKSLANVFNEMATKDAKGRNAMIFAMSQNPQYRQALEGIAPDFFKNGFVNNNVDQNQK